MSPISDEVVTEELAGGAACLSTNRSAGSCGRDDLRLAGRSGAGCRSVDRDVGCRLVRHGSVRRPQCSCFRRGTAFAAGAGLLANTRFLPMGFAIAPSMTGGPLRRLLKGAVLADASFVIGNRGGGRFDIGAVVWAAPLQYFPWIAGTIVGVAGAHAIGDPTRWGLDVLFPVFYLSLLLPELFPDRFQGHRRRAGRASDRSGRHGFAAVLTHQPIIVATLGAALALALTPIAPAGVPVLVAASAALVGLRPPRPGANTGDEA